MTNVYFTQDDDWAADPEEEEVDLGEDDEKEEEPGPDFEEELE